MIKEEEFDYQTYTRTHPPDASKIQRGAEARRQRFEAAQRRQVIRIDEDVLDEFRQLTPDAQDYERLINQALREWLSAQNVKELVREELHEIIQGKSAEAERLLRQALAVCQELKLEHEIKNAEELFANVKGGATA